MSETIILILAAVSAGLSAIDVLINGYIGYKKKHLTLECSDCMRIDYDSSSDTTKKEDDNKNKE